MRFAYKIAGRSPGVVSQTTYSGTVEAATPKEALVKALVEEFGDEGVVDPIAALSGEGAGTGWIDRDLLTEQVDVLGDDDTSFDLQAEEHVYAVEVGVETESDATVPGWLDQLVARMLGDLNAGYASEKPGGKKLLGVSQQVMKAGGVRGLGLGVRQGLVLVRIGSKMSPFDNTGGDGTWGMLTSILCKDVESGEEVDLRVIVNLRDGTAYLSNGFNRVGFVYPVRFGDREGSFGE